MEKKLTPKHLEILVSLKVNERPVIINRFKQFIYTDDLIDAGLINCSPMKDAPYFMYSCSLTEKGNKYFNSIIQYASQYFNTNMNSN